jgi:hypothetical protein
VDFIDNCTKIQGEDIEMRISCQKSPFIHFLPKIATNDDKVVEREAIEGSNRIHEGNHDDHDMMYDGKNYRKSSKFNGNNQNHEVVNRDD